MSFKFSAFLLFAVMSCTLAAPKPVTLEEIGRKVRDFGQRALPAVRGVCGFVNSYQAYPQNQGLPQISGYPQVQGYYPQYPGFPQYPQNVNPVATFLTSQNVPPTMGQVPPVGASEQNDLNKIFSSTDFGSSQNVPPQIQDVLKNFDNLPKFPDANTVANNKLINWENSNNNIL